MRTQRLLAFTAITLTIVSTTMAEDWPEFRGGLNGSGRTRVAFPTSWSETENVVWKVPVPGMGWSSPVVKNGAIFLTSSVGDAQKLKSPQSLRVLRLDGKTGKEAWNKELFQQANAKVEIHGKNSHASPTPIIEDNRLYVHFGSNGTACLTLDGEIVWTKVREYAPLHGNGGSPVIAGNTLIICCDGRDRQL